MASSWLRAQQLRPGLGCALRTSLAVIAVSFPLSLSGTDVTGVRTFAARRRGKKMRNMSRHLKIQCEPCFHCRRVACRGHRRVRGQGCARQAALGVPLGELWPNAGSSEAVGSENCGKVFGFQAAFCTRHLPNDTATIYLGWWIIAIRWSVPAACAFSI